MTGANPSVTSTNVRRGEAPRGGLPRAAARRRVLPLLELLNLGPGRRRGTLLYD